MGDVATPAFRHMMENYMKQFIALVAVACGLAAANPAQAHGAKPKHGGVVQSVNDVTYELVSKDGKAVIYVDDHGTARSTAGATGSMTVLTGTSKSEAVLAPSGANMLTSSSKVQLQRGSKTIASIALKGKEPVRVRFAGK